MATDEEFRSEERHRLVPDPSRIADRRDFAIELALARERAGRTVRSLAMDAGQPAATIGGFMSGQHLPSLRQVGLFRQILSGLGITDPEEVEQWVEALARVRRRPGPRPSSIPMPYRGLESFRIEDAAWFFGRESLTEALVARIAEALDSPNDDSMVVLVGPSGSGKSSLLRAGVVPAVLSRQLGGTSDWRCVMLSPGSDPIRGLANQLAAAASRVDSDIERGLRHSTLRWSVDVDERATVIIVDQFEEIFTMCSDEAERHSFIVGLRRLSQTKTSEGVPVVVVLGLRADFYSRASQHLALLPALQNRQVIVGSMAADELVRVIAEPARLAGFEVDTELVELLIRELVPRGSLSGRHDPGALPLLSHALLETFRRARGGRLTVADYFATDGISGAIRKTAESVFAELLPEDQALARRAFLRMVNVSDDAAITRRRVSRAELPTRVPGNHLPNDVELDRPASARAVSPSDRAPERILQQFVAQRLLTLHENYVEITHEALLTAWPRLRDWIEADWAGMPVRRQLREAALMWAEANRDQSDLLRGARLAATLGWASAFDHMDDLNDLERSFLDASRAREERESEAALEADVLKRRRAHLARIRILVGDPKTTELDVHRLIGDAFWLFGGRYVGVVRRRELLPLDQHDIPLIAADGSLHIVELKKPNVPTLIRRHRNHWIVGDPVHEAVMQAANYVRSADEWGLAMATAASEELGIDLDLRRVFATVVIGHRDHVIAPAMPPEQLDLSLRSYNATINRVRVVTYDNLIDEAERALRFDIL